MKIIDILNKKANGTLEDGFKFCYNDTVFTYNKKLDRIYRGNNILNNKLGEVYKLEECLSDKVLLFQEQVKETESREENKNIEELWANTIGDSNQCRDKFALDNRNKINELARAVNKLIKESEVKKDENVL